MQTRNMITVERDGPVAIVRFDRGEKRNAFNQPLIAQLTETGRLEIGEAQLVWRGKDSQD